MKQTYPILVSLLLCLSLLAGLTGCSSTTESLPEYVPVQKGAAITTSGVVVENGQFALGWDEEKKAIYLEDKRSGCLYGTMPSTLLEETETVRGHALTQAGIVLEYVEPNALGVTNITSTVGAVRKGRMLAFAVEGGIHVEYHFDELGISIPVTYSLMPDGLKTTCAPGGIVEGDKRVVSVAFAPMMASVPNDSEDSWLFVPSGSGALIDVATAPAGKKYTEEVYGKDPAHNVLVTPTNERGVRMPVFGAKQGDNAILGVISSGTSTASIMAQAGDSRVKYSSAYAFFAIRGTEKVEDAGAGTPRYIQIFSEEKNSEALLAVDYYPLTGEDASYVGMARRYRKYLQDNGFQLQKSTEQPLYINVLGGTELRRFFLGLPYWDTSALTTLEQARELVEAVSQKTGQQPVVKLVGFGEGGLDTRKPAGGLTVDSAMGGESGLKDFAAYCQSKNIPLYFDFDLVYFSQSSWSITSSWDAAKAPNRQVVRLNPVHLALRSPHSGFVSSYLVGHGALEGLANDAINTAKEWGLSGISFNSLSNTAYSDYDYLTGAVKSGADRRQSALMHMAVEAGLSVASSEANVYAVTDSSYLFDVPLGSSMQDAISVDIPFYEIVFKGYVPMGSEPVNMSADPQKTLLRAAEAGCGLTYTLSGSFEKEYLNSAQTMLGTTYYPDTLDTMKTQVERIAHLLDKVRSAAIVSHSITGDVREVRYDNGVTVLVNYGETAVNTVYGEIPAGDFQVATGGDLS